MSQCNSAVSAYLNKRAKIIQIWCIFTKCYTTLYVTYCIYSSVSQPPYFQGLKVFTPDKRAEILINRKINKFQHVLIQ